MSRKYLFTERAHLMCPNMGFAIAFSIKSPYDENRIKETIAVLSEAHPFLNAILGYEEDNNAYYYDVTDTSKVELNLIGDEISGVQHAGRPQGFPHAERQLLHGPALGDQPSGRRSFMGY